MLNRAALVVEFEPVDGSTPGHPSELPLNSTLVDVMGLGSNQRPPWHMTLGYCTKRDEFDESCEAYETDRITIENVVRSALGQELEVPLDMAKLCRFPNMKEFIPWD